MTVSGGIKFFDKNYADIGNGPTGTATTGSDSMQYIFDKSYWTYYRSVSESDASPETFIITLGQDYTFSRLFLVDFNFKQFTIKYDDGGYQDFSNVTGINNGSAALISETTYDRETAYYEFDEVTTDKIQIVATSTQIANQKKYLNQFIVSSEIGTLDGYPEVTNISLDRNLRSTNVLNGKVKVSKSVEVKRYSINFNNYPPTLNDDIDMIQTLFDKDVNFLVWLCGGRYGEPYFRHQIPGFRLKDITEVQVTNVIQNRYMKNYYNGPINASIVLEESV